MSYKRIWLQIGENQENEDRTWCQDNVYKTDVEYIRADEVAKQRTQIFKEVREKVIGKYNFTSVSAPINNDKAVEAAFHRHLEISGENKLRKEQLKKLKVMEGRE